MAQLPEPESIFVVAKTWAGKHRKPDIGEARGIAVAVLEAEGHQTTDDQCRQVLVKENRRRDYLSEDVQRIKYLRIHNDRKVHEIFDLPVAEESPDLLVFAQHVITRRAVRPHRALAAEPLHKHIHR